VRDVDQFAAWIGPFIEYIKSTGHGPGCGDRCSGRFLVYLQRRGLMSSPEVMSPNFPQQRLWISTLPFNWTTGRRVRGVCQEHPAELCGIYSLPGRTRRDPSGSDPARAIQGFITSLGGRYKRQDDESVLLHPAGFLRFCTGRVLPRETCRRCDGTTVFRHEECPQIPDTLGDAEGALDRGSTGRRRAAGLPPVFAGCGSGPCILLIRQTKFHKSRMVPVWPKNGRPLRVYLDARYRCCNLSTTKIRYS